MRYYAICDMRGKARQGKAGKARKRAFLLDLSLLSLLLSLFFFFFSNLV